MYYIYMLRCTDNSIYTGITNDIERRMTEHFSQDKNCAKYTLSHQAQKLECLWETENKQLASKLEYHIKTLTKIKKEEIIQDQQLINKYLGEKIDCDLYRALDKMIYNYYILEKSV